MMRGDTLSTISTKLPPRERAVLERNLGAMVETQDLTGRQADVPGSRQRTVSQLHENRLEVLAARVTRAMAGGAS